MIAKLDVGGKNRPSALQLLIKQLCNYQIQEVQMNIFLNTLICMLEALGCTWNYKETTREPIPSAV